MNALHISAGRISGSAMVKRRDALVSQGSVAPSVVATHSQVWGVNDGTIVAPPFFILAQVHPPLHTARAKRARRVRAPSSYVESSTVQVFSHAGRMLIVQSPL